MARFDPLELSDNYYNGGGGGVDDEKRLSNDLNLGFNEMDVIRDEIKKKQPLVSDVKPLSDLLEEFKEQPNFKRQIQALIDQKTHSNYRPMRQDGNCFYRAFLLALFESIEKSADSQLLAQVNEQAMSSLYRLVKFQYESFTIEDFYEAFMDELKWLQNKINSGNPDYKAQDGIGNTATSRLNNEFHSQSLIFWSRMLASVHIQENKDDFASFVHGKSLPEFIKADVEALHAEADHPQFSALSAALNVPFRVFCVENIDKGGPQTVHSLGENRKPIFDLLFRPGHYDIIYRSQSYDAIVNAQRQQTMGTGNDNNNSSNNNSNNSNNNTEMKSNGKPNAKNDSSTNNGTKNNSTNDENTNKNNSNSNNDNSSNTNDSATNKKSSNS